MKREEKIAFLKNPNSLIDQLIRNFINENEKNRRFPLDYGIYWEEPIVGFASGMDPLFFEFKTIIGSFHLTPNEVIAQGLKEAGRNLLLSEIEDLSVISWVLPASEDIRKSNRREDRFPSKLWTYCRDYGERFNDELRIHIVKFLKDLGYFTVAPLLSPLYKRFRDEKVGWTSSWSERHIAFACGLGTFGLNNGFITKKGMAVRLGSVVTLLKLVPTEKRYHDYREDCLTFRNWNCFKCISRCPAGAISKDGHDKDRCYEYITSEALRIRREEYGLTNPPPACGLCQTGVPCEFEIPRTDLIA